MGELITFDGRIGDRARLYVLYDHPNPDWLHDPAIADAVRELEAGGRYPIAGIMYYTSRPDKGRYVYVIARLQVSEHHQFGQWTDFMKGKEFRCHPGEHIWWLDPLLRSTRWCTVCGACSTWLKPPPTHPSQLRQCMDCFGHWWTQETFHYPRCPKCRVKYQAAMKARLKAKFRPDN